MLIRTVLDCRAASHKYIHQTLLLAASWHRNIPDRTARPLEVVAIGQPPDALCAFLRTAGVRVLASPPDPNDRIAKMSNTIVGAVAHLDHDRVLLLDNDIVFLREPDLGAVPADTVAAAIAGQERVTPRQWQIVERELQLAPLARTWVPLRHEQHALREGQGPPAPVRGLYVNGGVVFMPQGPHFALLWRRHVTLIARLFANHPERTPAVYGSVQAGLATAVGTWERFFLLPVSYNFRPVCFVLGKCSLDDLSMLHMSSGYDVPRECATSERIRDYWQTRILDALEGVRTRLSTLEYEQRVATARSCLGILTGLCADYELDDVVRACFAS